MVQARLEGVLERMSVSHRGSWGGGSVDTMCYTRVSHSGCKAPPLPTYRQSLQPRCPECAAVDKELECVTGGVLQHFPGLEGSSRRLYRLQEDDMTGSVR